MPRAKRRCAKPDCRNFHPCSRHPWGWQSAKTNPLPRNWKSLRKAVTARSGGRCEVVTSFGPVSRRCGQPMSAVDHIVNRARWPEGVSGMDDLSNLQAICCFHHNIKTGMESRAGRKAH